MATSSPRFGGSQPPNLVEAQMAVILGTGEVLPGLQIWCEHSQGPSEQKPIKTFGVNGVWAYSGTVAIFFAAAIFSGTPNYLRNG